MRIYFTKNAYKNFQQICFYIKEEFGINSIDKFKLKVQHSLELLAQHPKLGTLELESNNLYGLVIHKMKKIFYRIRNNKIAIFSLFRCSTKSKK
ncbi:MAG: type II toxin-antitoxin system RelE/ParE family toxin [Saprospiraceae bacterium]|nr:type II toxin-antitoxin system RelE/ParE family toxin [Saprospiraceae bacterium]